MAESIHHLAPARRADLVIAIQSYAPWPSVFERSADMALKKLRLDYADVIILGKKDADPSTELVDKAVKMRDAGKVRFLAISAHQRLQFRKYIADGIFDIIMVRYNAAHPGAETEVFPYLPASGGPGVIAYTATRWGTMLQRMANEKKATALDCYRFCLTQPQVHLCLSGPKNRTEMEDALRVLQASPMDADELAWMRRIGASIHERKAHNFLLRKLIFD
jgi:predicted aldo/keto reductase-like oxidoreductase